MGIPRFFKVPQHRQFNYEPIYYDERKERLEERIKQIEAEYGKKVGGENVRTLSRGSFSSYNRKKRKANKYSTTRLIIILLFLLFVGYYIFFA